MKQFHPIIHDWFSSRYGEPTDIQAMSWPRIADKQHLLITAPTGSGKTLTAFLWTLNRFVTGDLSTGKTRVLYISPLKALNNDIRRNLIEPLGELRAKFDANGEAFPDVQVATRSGDTEPELRRRMLRKPPEILITTPESLNILLTSAGGQAILYDIETVILDEIHAVVDSKRGVYLMSAVERLVGLSGEFQRIALSATVNPMEQVADFVAGFKRDGNRYEQRQVELLASQASKQYEISVRYPPEVASRGEDEKIWDHLAVDLLRKIAENNSTLIFVNSRALCETLTYKINNQAGRLVAYAHHGSLSREIRAEVEGRLKAGDLDAIVATSSLEMGIDIGSLDEVILVQSPGSIASSIQRIGRAGHQVNAASRCTIYPTHPQDFVEAAVLADSVRQKALEPVTFVTKPLDVLGQIIISMTGTVEWDLDELFAEVKRASPFNTLSRTEFDLVINMLRGRYEDHHIRELRPKVRVDAESNRIQARKGALLSLYMSGGVIPDRGYFQLRHEGDNARIGELDEEFVWEASPGQVFSLGTQFWQVKKITHNDVIVGPGKPSSSAPPFWKAEPINRSFHYSERINQFLESANEQLDTDDFLKDLADKHGAEDSVTDELIDYLRRQKEHTATDLPHRHHLLFEKIKSGPGRSGGTQIVMHTGWGAQVNRPLALALEAAWQNEFAEQPEVFVANESIVLQLTNELTAREILEMVPPNQIEALLRVRLEGSGFFGARFRENAGRALLLSKGKFNERKPLWMSRLQSQKLLDSVLKYEDFPILLETWRTCLQDEFDLPNLQRMLDEVSIGDIAISEITSSTPSPFAQSVAWDQINSYMYMTDTPKSSKTSNLSQGLLEEVVYSESLRPPIRQEIIDEYLLNNHRLAPGYAPNDEAELEEWLKDRSAIPQTEWQALCAVLEFQPENRQQTEYPIVIAADEIAFVTKALRGDDPDAFDTFITNWLQYYGPVAVNTVANQLGIESAQIQASFNRLTDAELLIEGRLIEGDENHYFCEAAAYEFLLRIQRASHRASVVAKPINALPQFLYAWQTRDQSKDSVDRLYHLFDSLRGIPVAAALWETDLLPSRIRDYQPADLDTLFQEGELQWIGLSEKQIGIGYPGDHEILLPARESDSELIPQSHARFELAGLSDMTGLSMSDLTDQLWQEAWDGKITNDSFMAVRRAVANNFKVEAPGSRRGSRRSFRHWQGSLPSAGNWYQLPPSNDDLDSLEQQEMEKERARLLLARYGILFRELSLREADAMTWSMLFRALRLMELSGEVVSGHFFEDIPGPQFMTPQSLRFFERWQIEQTFFINAADPISPSGLGLGIFGEDLPRRIPSNHLVVDGNDLVLTLGRRGRDINFFVPIDHEKLGDYLSVLGHLMYRPVEPIRQLTIETINGEPATNSPYLSTLEAKYNLIRDHKSIQIQREL